MGWVTGSSQPPPPSPTPPSKVHWPSLTVRWYVFALQCGKRHHNDPNRSQTRTFQPRVQRAMCLATKFSLILLTWLFFVNFPTYLIRNKLRIDSEKLCCDKTVT